MSVNIATAQELGTFAAIAVRLKLATLANMLADCHAISLGQCSAYAETYREESEPVSVDQIELHALKTLADKTEASEHFGSMLYNCVANNGRLFFDGNEIDKTNPDELPRLANLRGIEDACRKWQESERHRIAEQAKNAEAFDDMPPLPVLKPSDIADLSRSHKFDRIIYAEYRVDTSELQSDYFGCRTVRNVVIGFATGKRESFKQLRKAAGTFAPTKHLGPDKGRFTCLVVHANRIVTEGYGTCYEGTGSHYHDDIGNRTEFDTLEAAEQFIRQAPIPHSIQFPAGQADFKWSIDSDPIEHRENYSMGGGNYLGHDRYAGWIVRSCQPEHAVGMEYHEAINPPTPKKTTARTRPKTSKPNICDAYSQNV